MRHEVIVLNFSHDHQSVIGIGLTADDIKVLACVTEYALSLGVNLRGEQSYQHYSDQATQQYIKLKGQPPALTPLDNYKGYPFIQFLVTIADKFERVKIEVTQGNQGMTKDECDSLIADVAVPFLLYILCISSGAGFEKAIELTIEGAKSSYTTVFENKS